MDTDIGCHAPCPDRSRVAEQLLEAAPRLMRLIAAEGQLGTAVPLTVTQLRLLGYLSRGHHLTSELARKLAITPATTSEVVDLLVRRGLVERGDKPPDRRLTPLRITPTGLATLEATRERAVSTLSRLLDRLGPADVVELELGLTALLGVLRPVSERGDHAC